MVVDSFVGGLMVLCSDSIGLNLNRMCAKVSSLSSCCCEVISACNTWLYSPGTVCVSVCLCVCVCVCVCLCLCLSGSVSVSVFVAMSLSVSLRGFRLTYRQQ